MGQFGLAKDDSSDPVPPLSKRGGNAHQASGRIGTSQYTMDDMDCTLIVERKRGDSVEWNLSSSYSQQLVDCEYIASFVDNVGPIGRWWAVGK